MKEIIVIVGPTGVGKTKLSVKLAKLLDAEIINGDSVSIYKQLDIGSAKPSMEERDGIIHHLMDIKDVTEEYTVFDYQRDVRRLIHEIDERGKRIIIVGGTGLYIKAALYNYQFTEGTINQEYRELSNDEILSKIKAYSVEKLPEVQNRKRLVRMLNKLENSETISYKKDECLYPTYVIGLTCDRSILYERINQRVVKMLENGLLEEVTALKDKYPSSRILNSGIGYKEFRDYFDGTKSLEEVIEQIKLNSRRYAKRQFTFFRHQFHTHWYEVDFENFDHTIQQVWDDIHRRDS